MQKVRLGDIAILINGDRGKNYPSQVDITNDGEVPFVNAGHLNGREIAFDEMNYISKDKYEKLSSGKFQEGDILYCLRGSIGKKAIVSTDIKGAIASSLVIIRPNSEKLYGEYLMLALESPAIKEQLAKANNGSSQPNLSAASVREYEIELPELLIQREVVEKLVKVRDIIDNRRQELQLLDDLIKARFVELFGDPKINDKGWNSGIVSDYYEVKGGKRIPKGMGYTDEITSHPYLRATNMKNETILDDDIHYIDDEVYECIKRYTVKGGDIYLTNVGVNLGMAGVIPEKYDGANLTENAVKLVPKTEKIIDGVFLAHYINSPGIQNYINERKMSVGVPKLAIFRIETMPLLLPPMNVQIQFVEFCKQIDKSKSISETHIFYAEKSITPTTPKIFLKGRSIYGNEF